MTKLLDIINEQDPDAIVVIQGDHGTIFNYDWGGNPLLIEKSVVQDLFSIFNALKVDFCLLLPPVTFMIFFRFNLSRYFLCFLL